MSIISHHATDTWSGKTHTAFHDCEYDVSNFKLHTFQFDYIKHWPLKMSLLWFSNQIFLSISKFSRQYYIMKKISRVIERYRLCLVWNGGRRHSHTNYVMLVFDTILQPSKRFLMFSVPLSCLHPFHNLFTCQLTDFSNLPQHSYFCSKMQVSFFLRAGGQH